MLSVFTNGNGTDDQGFFSKSFISDLSQYLMNEKYSNFFFAGFYFLFFWKMNGPYKMQEFIYQRQPRVKRKSTF